MNIETNTQAKTCDFGTCANQAKYTITFDNCTSNANIDICENCLKRLETISKRLTNDKTNKAV